MTLPWLYTPRRYFAIEEFVTPPQSEGAAGTDAEVHEKNALGRNVFLAALRPARFLLVFFILVFFSLFSRKRSARASGPVSHAPFAAGHAVHPEPAQRSCSGGQHDQYSKFHKSSLFDQGATEAFQVFEHHVQ